MSTWIVRERNDGRGGIKPFGSYSKEQAGATVKIGAKTYKVTSDGRLNIPAKIMKDYGVMGNDGRRRIAITFTSEAGKKGWQKLTGMVTQPPERAKDQAQGTTLKRPPSDAKVLKPADSQDYSWSI